MKKNYQKLRAFIVALCLFSISLNAQLFSTVGAGTTGNASTGYPSPYGNWYWGAKHQLFVTAAELAAAGIASGAQIQSIGFNIYNLNGAAAHQNWVMNVYTTSNTDPLVSGWITGGVVAATSTSASVTGTIGWNQSTFTTPFIWNGTDNLVIETCFNNSSFTYNYSTYWMNNLTGTTIKSRWRNADNSTNCTDPPVSTSTNTRPDMRFEWISPTPCNGAPPANSVVGPTFAICPNASAYLSLANGYTLGGINYAWYSSTTSSVGPWTSVTGTNPGVSVPNQTATSYFMAVASCSSGGTTSLTAYQVTVQAVTTNTPPYFEGFEGISADMKLPNCSWSASNLGAGQPCQTYISSNTLNRMPRTGSKFASFYYSPVGTNYFYTNGIYMTAGITYSAAVWYTTEYYGYNNWTDLSIMYGPNQSTTGLVTIASSNGPVVSNVYKLLDNTFQVPTTGVYYVAIKATTSSGSAQYLSWDDLSITIPCTPESNNNPTLTLAPNSTTICAGESYNMSVTGADTYTWNTGDMGSTISNELYFTTPFEVVGTNALTGCTSTLNQVITVNPAPSVFLFASKNTVCAGESVNLTAMGASNYTWSASSSPNNVITVSPLTTTTYSVWGANSFGCAKEASQVINVNALPTITATSTAPVQMCVGEKQTLSASGGASFVWVNNTSNVVQSGANIIINPTSTSVYTVTGTDINGCSNVATITQVVDACTGISEMIASGSALSVYPNPGSGEYTLEVQSGLNSARMEVLDLTGKVILSGDITGNKTTVNLTAYANGVYFLKLQSDDSVHMVKLIKQ